MPRRLDGSSPPRRVAQSQRLRYRTLSSELSSASKKLCSAADMRLHDSIRQHKRSFPRGAEVAPGSGTAGAARHVRLSRPRGRE
jgi:hypothetical protein